MATDYEAELTAVNAAINTVLTGGQETWYNGRRVTNADLKVLREHRDYLEKKLGRAVSGGIRMRTGVPQ